MNNRLLQFINAENISQSQFADSVGVARASVSHILTGRNKPGYDFIESMAKRYPTLNLEWLITGKGKMYKVQGDSVVISQPEPQPPVIEYEEDDLFAPRAVDGSVQKPMSVRQSVSSHAPVSKISLHDTQQVPIPSSLADTANSARAAVSPHSNDAEDTNHLATLNHGNPANTRQISRIIIFYDDNTYQELK